MTVAVRKLLMSMMVLKDRYTFFRDPTNPWTLIDPNFYTLQQHNIEIISTRQFQYPALQYRKQ